MAVKAQEIFDNIDNEADTNIASDPGSWYKLSPTRTQTAMKMQLHTGEKAQVPLVDWDQGI